MRFKGFHLFMAAAVPAALLALAMLSGQNKPQCEPVEPVEPVCSHSYDCEGLPHILCLGKWECLNGECVWKCDETPPKCVKTGCSGEICAEEPVYSICIFEPWYECFKYSECGQFGYNGSCDWKETPEFLECLKKYKDGCFSDEDCGEGYHCEFPAFCGDSFCIDEPGKCVPDKPDECIPVKPYTHGACDAVLGWIYTAGNQCLLESGCSCEPDCAAFFGSQEECEEVCGIAPPSKCESDYDCLPGYYCDPCGCPMGALCFACIPACLLPFPCNPDKPECLEGYECKCMPDPDCPICAVCKFGCVPEKPKCQNEIDCGFGMYCDFSGVPEYCSLIMSPITPPECYGECKPDKDCSDNYCPMIACPEGTKMDFCTCKCVPVK